MYFSTLGKGQFKVMVKNEDHMHIYSIPAKHGYHYLSSIVNGSVIYGEHKVIPVKSD